MGRNGVPPAYPIISATAPKGVRRCLTTRGRIVEHFGLCRTLVSSSPASIGRSVARAAVDGNGLRLSAVSVAVSAQSPLGSIPSRPLRGLWCTCSPRARALHTHAGQRHCIAIHPLSLCLCVGLGGRLGDASGRSNSACPVLRAMSRSRLRRFCDGSGVAA